MKHIQLIVSDVDGTLLGHNQKQFSPELIDCLIQMHAQNKVFVLCSGRATFNLINIANTINQQEHKPLIKYVAGFNGGEIYDVINQYYIYQDGIEASEVQRINDLILSLGQNVVNYSGQSMRCSDPNNEFAIHESEILDITFDPLTDKAQHSPKVLGLVHPDNMSEILETIKTLLPDYKITRSTDYFIEINNKHVNKGHVLQVLCKHLNIDPKNTAGFGDNLNDEELISDAAIGVAMGNALEELKAKADIVIGHVDDNAVAQFIATHILE